MSGGSPEHSLIATNIIREIGIRLKSKPCRVYDSNLRIRVPAIRRFFYADGSILCATPAIDPEDPTNQSVTNPRVLIEVVSPTTEAYDRGAKFRHYQRLQSLEEYVMVSQTSPRVETFVRGADGTWTYTLFDGPSANIKTVAIEIPMAEIYAGITFTGAEEDEPPLDDREKQRG